MLCQVHRPKPSRKSLHGRLRICALVLSCAAALLMTSSMRSIPHTHAQIAYGRVMQREKRCPLCRQEILSHTTADAIIREPTFIQSYHGQVVSQGPSGRAAGRQGEGGPPPREGNDEVNARRTKRCCYYLIPLGLFCVIGIPLIVTEAGHAAERQQAPVSKQEPSQESAATLAVPDQADATSCRARLVTGTCETFVMSDRFWMKEGDNGAGDGFTFGNISPGAGEGGSWEFDPLPLPRAPMGHVTGDFERFMHVDVAPACGCREGQGKKISAIRVRQGDFVYAIELVYASGETASRSPENSYVTGSRNPPAPFVLLSRHRCSLTFDFCAWLVASLALLTRARGADTRRCWHALIAGGRWQEPFILRTGEVLVGLRARQGRRLGGIQFVLDSGRVSRMYGVNASAEEEWYASAGPSLNLSASREDPIIDLVYAASFPLAIHGIRKASACSGMSDSAAAAAQRAELGAVAVAGADAGGEICNGCVNGLYLAAPPPGAVATRSVSRDGAEGVRVACKRPCLHTRKQGHMRFFACLNVGPGNACERAFARVYRYLQARM